MHLSIYNPPFAKSFYKNNLSTLALAVGGSESLAPNAPSFYLSDSLPPGLSCIIIYFYCTICFVAFGVVIFEDEAILSIVLMASGSSKNAEKF